MNEAEYLYCDAYDYDPRQDCKGCDQKEIMFDECSEYMDEIVKQLYICDHFDVKILENCIEELAHRLKVWMPTCALKIQPISK